MPWDLVEANRQLAVGYAKTTAVAAPVAPIMGRLMTTNGTASSNGTEVANAGGSAYAPQSITAATPASPTSAVLTSNAAMTYTNMPDTSAITPSPGVKGIESWDSASTPRRIQLGPLAAAKVTALGDSLTIAAGNFVANNTL